MKGKSTLKKTDRRQMEKKMQSSVIRRQALAGQKAIDRHRGRVS
jgi:hypothetical protein